MKTFCGLFVIAALTLGTGCGPGSFYGNINTDSTVAMQATNHGGATKKGEACRTNILGLISTGDASSFAAAQDAGITKIANVNTSVNSILGLYAKTCTVVHGS